MYNFFLVLNPVQCLCTALRNFKSACLKWPITIAMSLKLTNTKNIIKTWSLPAPSFMAVSMSFAEASPVKIAEVQGIRILWCKLG